MDAVTQRRAISGMAWAGTEKLLIHAVRFVFGILMARILCPEDYGIVGLLTIFLNLSSVFIDSGFNSALIQKKERTEADYSTVFFFNLGVATFFYLLLFFAAPWIAAFYRIPLLTDVMRIVALGLPLNALCAVHRTRMTIQLNFRAQAVITLIALLLSGGAGLLLACLGYGVWALVWQGIASAVLTIVLFWGVARWRPQLTFSTASFNRFFSYGWKHLCSSLINQIYAELYTLVIGRKFSAADVGYYTRANSYAALPTGIVSETVVRVNFPILAQVQDDNTKLVAAYRKLLRMPVYLLAPILFGLGALAEPLIACMIGEKWLPCAPYLTVLCFGALFSPLTYINLNLLYVKGRTDCVLKLELIKKPLAFLILLSLIPFGIFWMCVGKAVYDVIAFMFNCYYTKKILNYGLWAQVKDIFPILLNAGVMAGIVFALSRLFVNPVVQVAVGVPAGMAVYLAGSLLLKEPALVYFLNRLKLTRLFGRFG